MDLNRTTLIGNVTKDPETKTIPSGQNVSTFSIATNKVWKDTNGAKQEKVEFHNLVAWGKTSDIVAQYVKKGMKLYVEGELQTRSWDDQEGKKRYRTEIIVNSLIMLNKPAGQTEAVEKPAEVSGDQEMADANEISIEDIPF